MAAETLIGLFFCTLSGAVLVLGEILAGWSRILLPVIFWALWLGSGCLAATAAELLKKPVLPHTLLGLLLPYVYPIWFISRVRRQEAVQTVDMHETEIQQQLERKAALADHFKLIQEKRNQARREQQAAKQGVSVEEIAAREEALRQKKAEKAPADPVPEAEAASPSVPAAAPEENEIYSILFSQEVDASGSRPGPFQFELSSGGTLEVECVKNMAQEFMICVISGTGKSLRVRYDQVASVARYVSE